jgi:hypothetical protein
MSAGERATPLAAGEARPVGFSSTNEHRAWIAGGSLALGAVFAQALSGVDGGLDAAGVAAATVAGYYAAGERTGTRELRARGKKHRRRASPTPDLLDLSIIFSLFPFS